jgi:hypothetical protein
VRLQREQGSTDSPRNRAGRMRLLVRAPTARLPQFCRPVVTDLAGSSGEGLSLRVGDMKSRLQKTALHIIILVAALVIISAISIWLGLGPVVHSSSL